MNPEHCTRVRERLDEALDGGLAPLEAARDAGHLEACADCAAESLRRAAWLAQVRAALAPAAELQRDADLRLGRALAAAEVRPQRRPLRRLATAALLAAAALVLLTLLQSLPGGASTLHAWTGGSLVALVPAQLPPVSWNPSALDPRMGH